MAQIEKVDHFIATEKINYIVLINILNPDGSEYIGYHYMDKNIDIRNEYRIGQWIVKYK